MSAGKSKQTGREGRQKMSVGEDNQADNPSVEMPYDQTSAPHDIEQYRGQKEFETFGVYERPEAEPSASAPEASSSSDSMPLAHTYGAQSIAFDSTESPTERDDMLLDAINERLTWSKQIESGGIRIKFAKGEVTLLGHVDSAEDKQLAEDLVLGIHGVKNVVNKLDVQRAS